MKIEHKNIIKISISFVVLFVLYHAAEYMILFKNSTIGFLLFQFLFFLSAWLLGNWNQRNGLGCWGLSFAKLRIKHLLVGVILGLLLYAVPFIISVTFGIESIKEIPSLINILKTGAPFAFGVFFSSFSEDILTRGTVFRLLQGKTKTAWIIILSAFIYLLNHIYRLNDGMDTLAYLFLLGVLFIIPLLTTKSLWITGFMHWAGNTFFFITHNVIQTENTPDSISPNLIFVLWITVLIPTVWYFFGRFKSKIV